MIAATVIRCQNVILSVMLTHVFKVEPHSVKVQHADSILHRVKNMACSDTQDTPKPVGIRVGPAAVSPRTCLSGSQH
jgi:hypothetical protein